MPSTHPPSESAPDARAVKVNPVFAAEPVRVPRNELPAGGLPPEIAYQVVHDELMLDGNARLNLATFVGTWAEPRARVLLSESFDKNIIDKDEYPAHRRPGAALRPDARRPLARRRPDDRARDLDHRLQRGGH